MQESEYHQKVEDVLLIIEEALDVCPVDIDYESASSILTLTFINGSKIIINKQPPLLQIWVATKYNGHHFNFQDGVWIDERTGAEFWSFIDEAASKQAEQPVVLSAGAK
ncbi:iron donor protein CyaY [Alteromonadaceae bacterium BrNp21-10]|nr:iron donor protein CyaY [Alteromonadaceae bacterium BrNp21-10]